MNFVSLQRAQQGESNYMLLFLTWSTSIITTMDNEGIKRNLTMQSSKDIMNTYKHQ